jgi:2-polyprenyl-3-methyl-5-hydroxy-6-metoxy-1,4-benzoquinol methylase
MPGAERARRPFYAEYAWAFDLLIDRPVGQECATIATWLSERRIGPGATILDAGCGTGRYAIELARWGYVVHGIDSSPELIAEARRAAGIPSGVLSFSPGDITDLRRAQYNVVLCRGVLNDFVDEHSRQAVFISLRRALRPDGVLILDVREWDTTAARKTREPIFSKRVQTERGTLAYRSITELDLQHRQLIVTERHTLNDDGHERASDYVFVMRCWTRDELDSALRQHGFAAIAYFGAYDPAVMPRSTDRLVTVAQV